ncbi:MAG: RDD family protein [Gammaproteobacteria bacterium]|nr:MAG: RDD family protein [Gammaproteobacteria bacterium]
MPVNTDDNDKQCSMLKRLAAMFYDGLCLFSLFFLATLILVVFTDGEAISSNNSVFNLFLFFISYLYFVWHWVNGGRTLGMRAWHICLYQDDKRAVSWLRASSRFTLATLSLMAFGAGFVWALFDANSLTFHDRYSRTRLVPKLPSKQ